MGSEILLSKEYKILGIFEQLCMLKGEETAIFGDDSPNEITLIELQEYSNALAAQLYYRYGVRSGMSVGLVCDGFVYAEVAAMLACVRLGSPFVPLDTNWLFKSNYFQDLIRDAEIYLVIVVAESDNDMKVQRLFEIGIHRCALLQPDGSISSTHSIDVPVENLPKTVEITKENKCLYILFTSGSTGKPKGVMGTEEGLLNRLAWQYQRFPWRDDDVACRRSPLTFVDSLAEVFGALLAGVPLWVPSRTAVSEGIDSIPALASVVEASRITLLPSQLSQILRSHPDLAASWPSLNTVFVSGEAVWPALVVSFATAAPHATLVNLYGSTEVAGDVTFAVLCEPITHSDGDGSERVEQGRGAAVATEEGSDLSGIVVKSRDTSLMEGDEHAAKVPIGWPIEGNIVVIGVERSVLVDGEYRALASFEVAAAGVVGELFAAGEHLALGYKNQTEETRRRFLCDPFETSDSVKSGRTYFRTGDIAVRRSSDDAIVWLGRKDRQVKIRGARLELEQAEQSIRTVLGVDTGVAVVAQAIRTGLYEKEESPIYSPEERSLQLILFVESDILQENRVNCASVSALKELLMRELPAVSVPAVVLKVDKLPLTSSGKINYPALTLLVQNILEDVQTVRGSDAVAIPANPSVSNQDLGPSEVHRVLVNVLRDVLPALKLTYDDPSNDQNFFVLGGDSMLAVEARWRISQQIGVHIKMSDLLKPIAELVVTLTKLLASSLRDANSFTLSDAQPNEAAIVEDTYGSRLRDNIKKRKLESENVKIKKGYSVDFETSSVHSDPLSALVTTVSAASEWKCRAWFGRSQQSCAQEARPIATQDSQGRSLESDLGESSLELLWKVRLKQCVDAAPTIICVTRPSSPLFTTDGFGEKLGDPDETQVIYVGSHGGDFVAIDSASGDVIWERNLGVDQHIEGAATCLLEDRLVLVSSYLGRDVDGLSTNSDDQSEAFHSSEIDFRGRLWAFRLETGALVWSAKVLGETKGSPIVDRISSNVWLGSHDHFLYLFNRHDGSQIFRIACAGALFAKPVISRFENNIYAACTDNVGTLHCFQSTDHKQVWKFHAGAPIFSSPTLSSKGHVVFGSVDGCLRCIDHNGSLMWTTQCHRPIFSSPCVLFTKDNSEAVVWGAHDGVLRCNDIDTGSTLWNVNLGSVIFSSPTVYRANRVVVATTAGIVYSISEKGELLSSIKTNGEVYSSPISTESIVAVGCRDDFVYCFGL